MSSDSIHYTFHTVDLPFERSRYAYFVGLNHNNLVVAIAKVSPWGNDSKPFVSGVHVMQTYRRKGVGRKLMRYIELTAKASGMTTLALYVHHNNIAAQELYRAEGFYPYLDSNDDILFAKRID